MSDAPIDLATPRRFHLVAIGGKAMSGMAELLTLMGHQVTGSDLHENAETRRLRSLGIAVSIGHDPANIVGADVVACSTAVRPDNVERVAADEAGIPVIGRPQLQGAIAKTRRAIAVSGTHGKSSTTAMLITILRATGLDPSYMVGASMGDGSGSAHLGAGEWFVIEADESDSTFLELGAEIALVTNVAADHLDLWGSLDAIVDGFERFLGGASGPTVVNVDDPVAGRLGRACGSTLVGAEPDADWRISHVVGERGSIGFDVRHRDHGTVHVQLPEPGAYNASNAAMAICAAELVGVPPERSAEALAAYPGLERRFQTRGEVAGVTVIDDFAHNPDKVASVLDAASGGGWGRVIAVFQPHRYSRTADLWQEFADSFVAADIVFITELDPSDEPPRPDVSGTLIVDAVRSAHPGVDLRWVPDRDDLVSAIVDEVRHGDLCLTIGAGDITTLADPLISAIGDRAR